MSIEVVRSEASTSGLLPCALCGITNEWVWQYSRRDQCGVYLAESGHLYLCEPCAELLSVALPTAGSVTPEPEPPSAPAVLRYVYVVLYKVMAGGRWGLWGGAYTTRDGALLQLGRLVEKGYTGQGHVTAVDLDALDKEGGG